MRARPTPPAPFPGNQIGAKAGADYHGDGLTVAPTESGARPHCLFQRLDGEAKTSHWLMMNQTGVQPEK
jgi:hypothetical protein